MRRWRWLKKVIRMYELRHLLNPTLTTGCSPKTKWRTPGTKIELKHRTLIMHPFSGKVGDALQPCFSRHTHDDASPMWHTIFGRQWPSDDCIGCRDRENCPHSVYSCQQCWRLACINLRGVRLLNVCDAILANIGYYLNFQVGSSRLATKQY